MVAALKTSTGETPVVAGKPYAPLIEDALARHGGGRDALVIGDRLDTDIAGAFNAGLDSMLVLSGSHRATELFDAGPGERPTFVGEDLRALLRPPLVVNHTAGEFHCGRAIASADDERLAVQRNGSTDIEAIWAAAHAAWWAADHGIVLDARDVLDQLCRQ